MAAKDLNVGNMIGATFAARNNVIIFQIERATASSAACVVFYHCGHVKKLLGLSDLGHVVFLYVMGTVWARPRSNASVHITISSRKFSCQVLNMHKACQVGWGGSETCNIHILARTTSRATLGIFPLKRCLTNNSNPPKIFVLTFSSLQFILSPLLHTRAQHEGTSPCRRKRRIAVFEERAYQVTTNQRERQIIQKNHILS